MEKINFKRTGILYYLHKFAYVKDPEDTCTYKRQLILSLVLYLTTLPISIMRTITFLFPSIRKDAYSWHGFKMHVGFMLLGFVGWVVGFSVIEKEYFPNFVHWHKISYLEMMLYFILHATIGLIILTVIGAVISGVIYCVVSFGQYVIKNIEIPLTKDDGEPNTQVGVMYKSAKEKWCKPINWN